MFHWLFSRRILSRWLFGMACLGTIVALLYAEENWRGKRAWSRIKHELEGRGEILDWSSYIPAPVPEDQNIFGAPKMQEWFVGRGPNEFSQKLSSLSAFAKNRHRNVIAELKVVKSDATAASGQADFLIRYDAGVLGRPPAFSLANSTSTNGAQESITGTGAHPPQVVVGAGLRETLQGVIEKSAASRLNAAKGLSAIGSQGITLLAEPPNPSPPARILLLSEATPTTAELAQLFTHQREPGQDQLKVEPGDETNTFLVCLNSRAYSAADYLDWSGQFQADFDLIREALMRPYARMQGNYEQPFATPIPNFIAVRTLAQTLAQRTQCYLLLGQPEKALEELTLLHALSRLLEAKPSGKPMTLVAAMINVAITGLYVDTLAEGLRLRAWRESQLIALQKQLQEIDLAPIVVAAFKTETAASSRTFETTTASESEHIMAGGDAKENLWQKLKEPTTLFLAFGPRGWVYQNIATLARARENICQWFDLEKRLVLPHKADAFGRVIQAERERFSPYTFLAAKMIPNAVRASQTLARTQTMVNEALIACGLERYRLVQGEYPESLGLLSQRFITKVPQDIIGGQPLKYRRTDSSQFVLYSIGWNEVDDGGAADLSKDGRIDYEKGDWVWQLPRQ